MAGIKMTFWWHTLIEVIMDNSWEKVAPVRIDVGVHVWVAMREANQQLPYANRAEMTEKGGLVVMGVPIFFDKGMPEYDLVVKMPENSPYPEKHYGVELWMEPDSRLEQAPPAVAEMKQVCDTERVKGE